MWKYNYTISSDDLYHYGVPGMRWGERRAYKKELKNYMKNLSPWDKFAAENNAGIYNNIPKKARRKTREKKYLDENGNVTNYSKYMQETSRKYDRQNLLKDMESDGGILWRDTVIKTARIKKGKAKAAVIMTDLGGLALGSLIVAGIKKYGH